ncbi:MAG: galactose ABC transporter substrate-binding protein [Solobacterium sp.]|nr:galactose ABC transporter substrate-binding protein [Solobacterium sp.]
MKKILACLMLFLAACTPADDQDVQNIRIGITVYDEYDTFIRELTDSFRSYATQDDLNVTIEINSADKSQLTQNSQVADMIEDGCDVICVNLVDRTAPSKIIEQARDSGIPVIFFNRELVSEDLLRWEKLYYVGADAYQSGKLQGEVAAAYLREHPEADRNQDGLIQYFVLEGEAGHQDAILRSESSVDTLAEEGIPLEKCGYAIANWNRTQAQTQVAALLKDRKNVELILANNDDMALGAIDAYINAGMAKENRPVIVGIDGTKPGLEAIVNGDLDGSVFNDMKHQAEAMYDLAKALAVGDPLTGLNLEDGKYIRLPYEKITPENVQDYMDAE